MRRLPTLPEPAALSFTFDGKRVEACRSDTIASALAGAGIRSLSRSFKYHRSRGLLCCAGHCPNCLVEVEGEPNVRACLRTVEEGMKVRSQNAWPSLKLDMMSLGQAAARLMPIGFYYKTFMRPRFLWPFYEKVLRRAAGLGRVDRDAAAGRHDKQYVHGDVVVVGGGPAGLAAALEAASSGASVLLFEEWPALGGHLRFGGTDLDRIALGELVRDVEAHPSISVFTDTAVSGWYQDHWLAAVRGTRLFKVRAGSVVVATGAHEVPLVFANNDLPGVMLGSGVQRLLHLHQVAPAGPAVVVTANADGWRVAADLHAAGVEIAAVVDQREAPSESQDTAAALSTAGVPIFQAWSVLAAKGSGRVQGAVIAPLVDGEERAIRCDLIAVSVGWTPLLDIPYMAGAEASFDDTRNELLADNLPDGMFVAGRAAGHHSAADGVASGRAAAASAIRWAAGDTSVAPPAPATGPVRTGTFIAPPDVGGGKPFVCYCEDVVEADLSTGIAEGYDSMELLKRYSTVSMGPCQGRMCSVNTMHLCARATHRTLQETGRTTARPPVSPVPLGVLAGQSMSPVQLSPIHDWHSERGARMMVAGLWLRPEHYGDPFAEVRAVRERVGLIDVSPLGKLRLTGAGVPDLLSRIYINKWRKLDVGRVRYGVMCNDEGVVMDDGVCARLADDDWYMSTTSSGASAVFDWIQWWSQSGWGHGVHITDLTETFAAFNLAGPRARDVLNRLGARDIENEAFPYMHVRFANLVGVPCRLLRIGFTGELSYEIHCPAGAARHLWDALMDTGRDLGIAAFGVEAQRVLRLEKGHIIVGQDTDALTDPFGAGLGPLVKLDKEDFFGRPSLERIAANGSPQRLVGFRMARSEVVPEEGRQVVRVRGDGSFESIGWITSSRRSPTLGESIGLCWLPADVAAEPDTPFLIHMDGALEQARVHHGAFYDPEGERLTV